MAHVERDAPQSLVVTSPAFESGGLIPRKYALAGENVSPPIVVDHVPDGTAALALVLDDPDAPGGAFTHWTVWNLPPGRLELEEGADVGELGAEEGATDFGDIGYGGPDPPSGTHRYFVRAYALRNRVEVPRGASREELEEAIGGRVLAWGELMGRYARTAQAETRAGR